MGILGSPVANYDLNTLNLRRVIYMDVGYWGALPGAGHIASLATLSPPIILYQLNTRPGNASTTFGLVCGKHAFLCDWLGKAYPGGWLYEGNDNWINPDKKANPKFQPSSFKVSDVVKKFFEKSRELSRGYILSQAAFLEEVTPPNKPLLVLPDLHLPLFVGTPLDRFRYRPTDDSDRLFSLDSELRQLLDIAKDSEINATTAQVGDMYEVWESEIVLRYQYLNLFKTWYMLMNHDKKLDDKTWDIAAIRMYGSPNYSEKIGYRERLKRLLSDLHQIILGNRLKPDLSFYLNKFTSMSSPLWDPLEGKFFIETLKETPFDRLLEELWQERSSFREHLIQWGRKKPYPDGGIDFKRTDEIIAAIRKSHWRLFLGEEKLFDIEIKGNHDNRLRNMYWSSDLWRKKLIEYLGSAALSRKSSISTEDWAHVLDSLMTPTVASTEKRIDHVILSKDIGADGELKQESRNVTANHRIWLEHGHVYDWHNNDNDFDKDSGRGFSVVENMKLKITREISTGDWTEYLPGDKVRYGVSEEGALKWAPWVTDLLDYEMRFPALRRTDQVFGFDHHPRALPNIRLVIMGHTHNPCLWGSFGGSFFSVYQDKQGASYDKSKYMTDVPDKPIEEEFNS